MKDKKKINLEITKILENHEKRITALEGKKTLKSTFKNEKWYKPDGTIEKVVLLAEEGFFNVPHGIGEIILILKTKDYHLKASDLTLPLRRIVRKGILKRTKIKSDSSPSKKWLYIKV